MKKTVISITLFAAMCAVIIPACKKKTDDPAPVTPTTPATSVICDGNGTTSYYPLVLNNVWSYKDGFNNTFSNTVNSPTTFGSFSYFNVDNTLGGSIHLRSATNGDIMVHSNSGVDMLYIPASPTNNQTWTCDIGLAASRKVISTNASLTTSSCTYSGLLKIQNLNASSSVVETIYYKKGLGVVSTDVISPGDNALLTSVTLH